MVPLIYLAVFLAISGRSSATYCLCKDGNEQALQKAIDYACGNGADCSAINQNGACYNPNTVKDHCNYAVNSYFQKKAQVQGSCDFSGAATLSANPPPNVPSTCSFPSSGTSTTPTTGTPTTPTTGTPTTPTTGTPTTGTPTTGTPTTGTPTTGTPTTGTPTTGTPTTGTPTTGTPTTGTPINPISGTPTTPTTGTNTGIPSTTPTTGTPTVFGGGTTLGPTGTTTGYTDPNHAVSLFTSTATNIFLAFAITLWVLGSFT